MSSSPSAEEIARDARWLVQAVDPNAGMARLVAMTRDDYRSASFLDDRMMSEPRTAPIVPWPPVAEAAKQATRLDARWIFHIGHVGSTLVSRMVGELPGVLAVREPRSLRDAAMFPPEVRAPYTTALPRLFSRTFAGDETACVKVTSYVSEIAAELVPSGGRVLFMTASPRDYVASILAGPNSLVELRSMHDYRAGRMAGRVDGLDGSAESDAHRAAAAWACEMTSLEASAEALPGRPILWCDFDALLRSMKPAFASIADHFGFAASDEDLTRIISGPVVSRYSKDMSYDYSPQLRRDLLGEADRTNRSAIDSALAMLDRAAVRSPLLKRALERARELECSASSIS